jgi:hypothetical protein
MVNLAAVWGELPARSRLPGGFFNVGDVGLQNQIVSHLFDVHRGHPGPSIRSVNSRFTVSWNTLSPAGNVSKSLMEGIVII